MMARERPPPPYYSRVKYRAFMHLQANFSRSNLNPNDLTAKISKTMSYEAALKPIQQMVGSAMWNQLHVLRSLCAERGKLTANWRKKK